MANTPMTSTTNGHNPGGAPLGNTNNMRHGLRAGKLPEGCEYIANRTNAFRRTLEASVLDVKGSISIGDAASIQTALRWERHAALALHWLRHQHDSLSAVERLSFSREIARASTERDKAIAALGLDVEPPTIDLATYLESRKGPENEASEA